MVAERRGVPCGRGAHRVTLASLILARHDAGFAQVIRDEQFCCLRLAASERIGGAEHSIANRGTLRETEDRA